MLDRVGIYQAIARCQEKLGILERAAFWHERAGRGYMKLPISLMSRQERAYCALGEFHAAIQDHAPKLSRRSAVQSYLKVLAHCLKAGKGGYSHEMFFAARLCAKTGMYVEAAVFFTDTALQFQKERQSALAHQSYSLAVEYSEKSRNANVALKLRAAEAALE